MDIDAFWRHVEAARASGEEAPEDGLREELSGLSGPELIDFQTEFERLFDAAYRWDLWGAAYL